MKTSGNQKKIYLLALILLIVAVALACVWTFWGEDIADAPTESAAPSAQSPVSPTPSAGLVENTGASAQSTGNTMATVVYYQDNYGYLVPVMCNVAFADGIAKETLNRMVQSPENDMTAARLGLKTVLPADTTIDLDIADGLARIDLSADVLDMTDAAAETNMITAIVQTLTEFESVQRVEFLVDGKKIDKLTHGTSVSGVFERGYVNPETTVETAAVGSLEAVKLYFPCESSSVVVPVTRMVYSKPDINTAVLELTKGPGSESPLERALPAGCGLIDVQVENGVARINFTEEFTRLVENSDGGRMALKALVLTCTQFEGVRSVEILVEGEPYDPGKDTLAVPSFANISSEIEQDYIQTQSNLIFDFE